MSCWVVPSIAAEIWGVSLQHIMHGMQAGTFASKSESGFTFVDVAPHSPKMEGTKRVTPPTYTVVTHEEVAALIGEDEAGDDSIRMGDWRSTRDQTQKLRQPPMAA